jgi:hypothetical protein
VVRLAVQIVEAVLVLAGLVVLFPLAAVLALVLALDEKRGEGAESGDLGD